MGQRGPVPKPPAQKRREGNAGKRKIPEPPTPGTTKLTKPRGMPPAAGKLWNDLVAALADAGVARSVDGPALSALCLQWERAAQAGKAIKRDGILTEGSTGQLVEHPAVKVERSAHLALLSFCKEYGLTPAARLRLATVTGSSTPASIGASAGGDTLAERTAAKLGGAPVPRPLEVIEGGA